MPIDLLRDSLFRHIGQTVTVFTESGGLSGSGFTGVLAGIGECTIKLITSIGAAPTCPVGSDCTCGAEGPLGLGLGFGNGFGNGFGGFGNGFGGGFGGGSGCGSNCCCNPCGGGFGGFGNNAFGGFGNGLGSIAEIPINKIVSFTHNAIS